MASKLTLHEVAERVGVKPDWVRQWVRHGGLPTAGYERRAHTPGPKPPLFEPAAVEAWLYTNTRRHWRNWRMHDES